MGRVYKALVRAERWSAEQRPSFDLIVVDSPPLLDSSVKKILKGKANPEENAFLRPGDTVIAHGNLFKTLLKVSNVVGVTTLATFVSRGGR